MLLALVASPVWRRPPAPLGSPTCGASLRLLVAREVVIGLCLALVASAVFRAAEMAGRLADTLRGANVAEILVPTSEERASPLGVLYLLLATLRLPEIGGVPRVVEALVAQLRGDADRGRSGRRARAARRDRRRRRRREARRARAVALAAPVIVALWLTDLALGLIARAAPPSRCISSACRSKGCWAIGVVLLGLGALEAALAGNSASWLRMLRQTPTRSADHWRRSRPVATLSGAIGFVFS